MVSRFVLSWTLLALCVACGESGLQEEDTGGLDAFHEVAEGETGVARTDAAFRWRPAAMRFVTEDRGVALPSGDTMHYTETGPALGKPLLFVHGYPSSPHLYRDIVDDLCGPPDTPYRCIALSMIGFGKSSCPGDGRVVTPIYEADRVDEFIQALNLQDFVAVVHDWGGPIGTAAALRHADSMSHLIVLNTFFRWSEGKFISALTDIAGSLFASDRPILELISPAAPGVFLQLLTERHLGFFERFAYAAPFLDKRLGTCRVRASIGLFNNADKSGALYDEIEARLATDWAGRPAIFLWGTEDPLLGPKTAIGIEAHETMRASLPQASTILIEGANHFMQEDRPHVIASEIRSFLARAAP